VTVIYSKLTTGVSETVVITGALGGAGSWVVNRLRRTYDVVAVDRILPRSADVSDVDFRAVDLADQGPVWEIILDADPTAVVHFGNTPHEGDHAGGEVYENNATSTYHTLEAAGRTGARVVWASSETVYGTHWPEPPLPSYLPVDEKHPVAPWNGYETSKLAGEMAAERITNAFDVPVASIRPSWIQYPGEYVITSIREEFSLTDADRSETSGRTWISETSWTSSNSS
jgi:nucleoside-diphosphate-sugar epimerase